MRPPGILFYLLLLIPLQAETIHQPLMDYNMQFPGEPRGAAPRINSFENFTHIGTDFGWMGPGESRIDAGGGCLSVRADGPWTGAWHSLSGLAIESERLLNPRDVLGLGGPAAAKAELDAIVIKASGAGKLRVEMLTGSKSVVWTRQIDLVAGTPTAVRLPLTEMPAEPLKFLNWVAEPGVEAHIESITFDIKRPQLSPEEFLFQISLGKLRRCHDPASGLTRDRAHLTAGRFDSVPVSGLHALATAVAAREGLLDAGRARQEVLRTIDVVGGLSRCHGFLPHFTRRGANGAPEIHPGTEYSTVDTAIVLQSLRLATVILGEGDAAQRVNAMIQALDFDAVTDAERWVHHGWKEDGKTLLPNKWEDWGGEVALILTLEAMIEGREPRGRISDKAEVFRSAAFIAEIQSLLYPDFDSPRPDQLSKVVWPDVRRALLERQRSYLGRHWPASAAWRQGLFGFSAGEAGRPGDGYAANGSDLPGLRWLHPHAMVMLCAMSGDDLAKRIEAMDQAGFLHPFGLPEAIEIDFKDNNPMLGGLNAGFEALASYHAWKKRGSDGNLIDRACFNDPLMRRGAERFYPKQ
ncbi:MAG TPA: hypothetical protein VFY13_07710 [Luteolibacter sp.]|nr:hypothetical protein [Luteolibacter sp.]